MENYKTYLNNIVRNVPGAIYWKDINGVYLGCNDFEAKIVGLQSPDEIVGKTDYDLPWRNNADILRYTDNRVMESQLPKELIESSIIDGKRLIMLSNKAPLYDEQGKVIGIIGTSIDITARVEAEEREKSAQIAKIAAEAQSKVEEDVKRAVMVLAGSIAHDLRTPLVTLSMINRRLQNYLTKITVTDSESSQLSETNFNDLHSIPNAIKEIILGMHEFIDHNLKALKNCRIESMKDDALVICKSYKGINNALDAFPFKPGQRELIQTNIGHYFDFLGNPVLFLRIMFNLIDNALYQIQENSTGHIIISTEEDADHNIIRFKDTAGGASAQIVEHIFDGYVTSKEKGTGVGLAFCKLTMESFGGIIYCQSEEGDFMEFTLKFPKIIGENNLDVNTT